MPLSKDIVGVKGDECQCGRRDTIRHCPSCGSTRSYARLNRYHKHLNGEIKLVDNEYRCQSCGHLYIDEERALCEAPPVGQKLASQRVRAIAEAKATGQFLNPAEEKLAKAITTVVGPALTTEELSQRDRMIRTQLRHAHMTQLLAHKQNKGEHPGEVEAYINTHFEEAKRMFEEATK
jgi:hypothetical protein